MIKKALKKLGKTFCFVLTSVLTVTQTVSPLTVNALEPAKGEIRNPSVVAGSLTNDGDVLVTKNVTKINDDGYYKIDFNVKGLDFVETESLIKPIYVVVVFDQSGSMLCNGGTTKLLNSERFFDANINGQKLNCTDNRVNPNIEKWNNAVNGAISFSTSLLSLNNTYLSLVTFSDSAENATAFSKNQFVASNFNYPYGMTDLGGAINKAQAALNTISNPNAQKYIVVISDGEPNHYNGVSNSNAVNLAISSATNAKNTGTKIFTIGYNTNSTTEGTLRSISSNNTTDSVNYYFSASTSNVTSTFQTVFQNFNTYPSGTNAVLTDVLGSEFTFVSSNTDGVSHNNGIVTYSIPTINETGTSFSFNVKINENATTGWHKTNDISNKGVRLNYVNYNGVDSELVFDSSPEVYWVQREYSYIIKYYNEGSTTLLGTDTKVAYLNDIITSSDIDLDKYKEEGYVVKSINPTSLTIGSDNDDNIIIVTYGLISDLSYKVEYYYDGVIDDSKTEIKDNITYGTLTSYTDKLKDGYEFASVTGNNVKVTDNSKVVKVYYERVAATFESTIDLTGTDVLTNLLGNTDYILKYYATIRNYFGRIKLLLVDNLPYRIDPKLSDLDGGEYDDTKKTITWTIDLDINTYNNAFRNTDDGYLLDITKIISVKYLGIEPTIKKICNIGTSNLMLIETEQNTDDEDDHETELQLYGKVLIEYFDEEGNSISDQDTISGMIGEPYIVEPIEIKGYKLLYVSSDSDSEKGTFDSLDKKVKYVYEKESSDVLATGIFNNYGAYTMMSSISLAILIKFRKKFLRLN
jgi:uncharacterized protein YegL